VNQRNPAIMIIDQAVLSRALVAEPEMLYLALMSARTDERGPRGFSRLREAVSFYQKEFSLSKPQERL